MNTLFRWIVHSRGINETLTIEANSCATEHDSLVTIAVTRGLRDLLSVRSCAQHIDCPSAFCIPIRDISENIREERGLRTLFLVNEPHNGVCVPMYVTKENHFMFSNH